MRWALLARLMVCAAMLMWSALAIAQPSAGQPVPPATPSGSPSPAQPAPSGNPASPPSQGASVTPSQSATPPSPAPTTAAGTTAAVDPLTTIFDKLSTLVFAIAAFLATFFTLLRNHSSLRQESGGIFYAILFCVIAGSLFLTGYVLPPGFKVCRYLAVYGGGASLFVALFLFVRMMWRSYVRLTFLHEGKGSWKFFFITRWIRAMRPKKKSYEFGKVMERKDWTQALSGVFHGLANEDFERVRGAGSILLVSNQLPRTRVKLLAFVAERLEAGDTVNYVTFTTSPVLILQALKKHLDIVPKDRFVFIDAYSQTFGFHDDIVRQKMTDVEDAGIRTLYARTCAGIHGALKQAFNHIKKRDTSPNERRPCLMVYDSLSSFALTDGEEQVRLFLYHMIPSERSYQMVTVLVEHDGMDETIRDTIEGLVDATVEDVAKSAAPAAGTETKGGST